MERELAVAEKLLWAGQPGRGLRFRPVDRQLVPITLVIGGFAFLWETYVIQTGLSRIGAILGLPFVLIALYLVVGRFLVDAWQRRRTFYGVTDQRVIVVRDYGKHNPISVRYTTPMEVLLTTNPDRSGTVSLGFPHPLSAWSKALHWPGFHLYETPQLEFIPDAAHVYGIIEEQQDKARK